MLLSFNHLTQRKLSNKRGPPVLQNRFQEKGNTSVIDTDQATEGIKEKKEDFRAIQEVLSKETGIFFTQFCFFNYQISIFNWIRFTL